jgi:adenine/guanine phosphoribosyltransferase-like PRPP-binding protein
MAGRVFAMAATKGIHRARVGSQSIDLPIVPMTEDLAIGLLICVDHGVAFSRQAGVELADLLAPFEPEIVVSVATMGIPLAIEASRALGLDDYLILHKTPKVHLGDTLAEPLVSITTASPQQLRMDPARAGAVTGKRVALVDDVISTGASVAAALRLLRRVEAEPVVIGAFVTEASGWREALGPDADRVRVLGSIPVFHPEADGDWAEDWGDGG